MTRAWGATAAFLRIDRIDVRWLLVLTSVAFVLRFFSPLMPDFIAHPFQGWPVTDCVKSTPVDPKGDLGRLCGLSYPFQRGYSSTPGGELSPPDGQVFDEIYFATFAHDDLKGVQYFDPEPPMSKLIIGAGMLADGWFRATFEGAKGSYADLGYHPFGWRVMSALFGTLCIPMMFLLARRLWPASRVFAIAAAVLVCFDGMFFIQSRIGMIDVFPIFFILCAYWLYLVHLDSRSRNEALVTLIALGIVLGLAISSKWIALAAYASIVFLFVVRLIRREVLTIGPIGGWKWGVEEGLEGPTVPGGTAAEVYAPVAIVAMLAIPAVIYFFSWTPFFMRGQFHTLTDLWNYNKLAYDYHANLTATHPYGSPWWSWPLLLRPVAYYFQGSDLGADQWSGQPLVGGMVNLGNPWMWWSSLPCLLALPYYVIRERSFPAAVILIGFVTQWLPWSRITRVIFLYHMFGGLPFMLLALAFVLGRVAESGWSWRLGSTAAGEALTVRARHVAAVHLAIGALFFAYFYPVWTALPISNPAYLTTLLPVTDSTGRTIPGQPPWGGKMWVQINCVQPQHPTAQSWVPCWI